jgi:hypothetical protein
METQLSPIKKADNKILLMGLMVILLLTQIGLSIYAIAQSTKIENERAKVLDEINQIVQTNSDLSSKIIDGYNKDVYHNSDVDSAIKQQVVGNDYIISALTLLSTQNNDLLHILYMLR